MIGLNLVASVSIFLFFLINISECRSNNTISIQDEELPCLKSKSNNITCPVTYDTDPASSECKPECIKSNDNTTSCTFCYRYVFNSTNVNNSLGYYPDPSNPMACMRMPNYNKKNKCNNTVQQSTISKTSEETSVATYIFNLYIYTLTSIIAILLIVVFILTFIIIRIKKQASMRKEEAETDDSNYYSSIAYHKKSKDVSIENSDLYGDRQ
ncbi:hypothetical protein QE152_g29427 [Popillia japonica]|uniref:Uncharacterized protein n=1 Tax=Popillia japonica TaxID=7064 RepID=A0AAW1JJ14_POPJA